MGLEMVEQVPDLDAVVIPVGGGGMIAGAALAIKSLYPHVKVIVSIKISCILYLYCVMIYSLLFKYYFVQ